jgi:outer membrane protein OmpA-like peptidoglycan-associated protein
MKHLNLVLLLLISLIIHCYSQESKTLDISQHGDCNTALKINIKETIGPTTAPSGHGNVLEIEDNKLGNPHYFEKEHNTTWYKFIVPEDGKLSFDIIPQEFEDDYDFMLFKLEKDEYFFCNYGVKYKNCKPIRTNISRNKVENKSMTGLNNSSEDLFVASGLGKSYSQSIDVKQWETYFLVVDNVYDNGSGHSLNFYYGNSFKIKGTVSDINTKEPIKAEIKIENADHGNTLGISISQNTNGAYKLNIENDSIIDNAYYTISAFADNYFFEEKVFTGAEIKNGLPFDFNFNLSPIKQGENFAIRSINFYSGTANFLPSAGPSLERLLRFLLSNPSLKIVLEGHTNGVGTTSSLENHMILSKRRAEAVAIYLISNKISGSRISCKGFGYSKMIYPTAETLKLRRANMRVELTVLEFK